VNEKQNESPSIIQRWTLASRPKTLPAAASPVLVGWAIAIEMDRFALLPAITTLFIALLIQIGANLVNDVSDYHKGTDAGERLGPLRVTQAGLLSPRQMWYGVIVVLGLAAILGLYLVFYSGWPALVVGLASILGALFYSVSRYSFSNLGLGDLFAWLFFGFGALCGTVYVLTGSAPHIAWLSALPVGALVTAILVVNNIRDIESDRRAGRKNIPVVLGRRAGEIEYIILLVIAYVSPLAMLLAGEAPYVLLPLLSIPMGIQLYRKLHAMPIGKPFNILLAQTARLTLVYSLMLGLGILI
jgi:1,4-dihydroxy-2-naphthoate octaprenyltransferase